MMTVDNPTPILAHTPVLWSALVQGQISRTWVHLPPLRRWICRSVGAGDLLL